MFSLGKCKLYNIIIYHCILNYITTRPLHNRVGSFQIAIKYICAYIIDVIVSEDGFLLAHTGSHIYTYRYPTVFNHYWNIIPTVLLYTNLYYNMLYIIMCLCKISIRCTLNKGVCIYSVFEKYIEILRSSLFL